MSHDYDKDLINREVVAICDFYLTDKRGEGKRQTYICPECGDRNFEVDPDRGYAGCFDAGCEAPTTTDALGVIAYYEDRALSGEGFVVCLKKGYEILGIVDPGEERKGASNVSTNGSRRRAMTPRKERASSRETAMTPRADRDRGEEQVSGNGHGGVHSSGPQWGAAASSKPEASESALLEQPIQAWQVNEDGTTVPVAAVVMREPEQEAGAEDGEELEDAQLANDTAQPTPRTDRQTDPTDERQTAHEVFEELLKLCKREERDESFLIGRGLDERVIEEGRFGSISKERCNYVVSRLRKKFSDEELLSVPGFRKTDGGQMRLSLYGDYTLIPYFDNEGYIRTVEGRFTGEEMGEYDKKYKALLNSAVHLYVHPRYKPDEVVAICEGAIGAMVAARYGFAVASIKGFRNYRCRVDGDGNLYTILPELEGVDFAGKVVVYIPDVDVKPKSYESVMNTVPKACHWMIERQGGIPKVAMLPEGAKDLDAWILSLEEGEREGKIKELLAGAMPVEQFEAQYLNASDGEEESQTEFEEVGGKVSGVGSSSEHDSDRSNEDNEKSSNTNSEEDAGESEDSNEDSNKDSEDEYEEGGTDTTVRQDQPSGEDETARMDLQTPRSGEGEDPGWQQLQLPTDEHTTEAAGKEDETTKAGKEDETTSIEVQHPQHGETSEDHEREDYESSALAGPIYNAHVKGERYLAVVVYVITALVLSAVVWTIFGGWLIWWANFLMAAGLAIPVVFGFSRLAGWHNERKMKRHIEGK